MLPPVLFLAAAFGAAGPGAGDLFVLLASKAGFSSAGIPASYELIFFKIRLPRILLAAVTGAGLASAGAVFQAVLQNPLAEPYLLGVSSGASLGATVAIIAGVGTAAAGIGGLSLFAFAGACLTILLVMAVSGRLAGGLGSLLLGGIAVGYIFQAAISLLMMLNREQTERIVFWMMGSFAAASWAKVAVSAAVVAAGLILMNSASARLNIISLGPDHAHSLGINPSAAAVFFLLTGCLVTAAVVSVSGIIGFVGLIVPHLLRFFTGSDHRRLLPACAAGGAILLVLADLAARTLLAPQEIPVGVITAVSGGPFFLFLLRRKRRREAL